MKTVGKALDTTMESVFSEDDFILVEAEKLSLKDRFMKWKPRTEMEHKTKELIKEAINKGVKNFYRPKYDPSYTDDGKSICFVAGKQPANDKGYIWWEKVAKEYCPERNSRLGTRLEYAAFLGVLIKKLVRKGRSVKWAWNAVCNDSTKLGHYWNSINKKVHTYLEPTGSRCVCGFYDLANLFKVIAEDSEDGGFWVVGGVCDFAGECNPIASYRHFTDKNEYFYDNVGWIVLS